MAFSIETSETAKSELKAIKLFERKRIKEQIETHLRRSLTRRREIASRC